MCADFSLFNQYTERARRVIFFARYFVCQFGGARIETGHLLLAVLKEDLKVPQPFLGDSAVMQLIRMDAEASVSLGETALPTYIDIPLSEECKRVLAYARDEAVKLSHRHNQHIGVEHLVLAILREDNCGAAEILRKHGLQLEALREKLGHTGA